MPARTLQVAAGPYHDAAEHVFRPLGPVVEAINATVGLAPAFGAARSRPQLRALLLHALRRGNAIRERFMESNRPQVRFESWGNVPADDPGALRRMPGSILGNFLQNGFHFVNDGVAAHEITLDSLEIEPGMYAKSKVLKRIAGMGKGFVYVWLEGNPPSSKVSDKWDLIGAMAQASDAKFGGAAYRPPYTVRVSVTYRDADGVRYRSSADMSYVQSRGQIEFGPTTQEVFGEVGPTFQTLLVEPTKSRSRTGRGGRPSAVPIVAESVRELRGELSQGTFARVTKLSVDVIQRAERGEATESTIHKLCKFAKSKGSSLVPKTLRKKMPQKTAKT